MNSVSIDKASKALHKSTQTQAKFTKIRNSNNVIIIAWSNNVNWGQLLIYQLYLISQFRIE